MDNILVVTTFHKPGLDSYGQRMLDTFATNVDKRIKLVCYAEDCDPVNPGQIVTRLGGEAFAANIVVAPPYEKPYIATRPSESGSFAAHSTVS